MPVQRRVFRIEESVRPHSAESVAVSADANGPLHREFMNELQALRKLMQPHVPPVDHAALEKARAQIAEAQSYKHELGLIYAAVGRTREEMTALGVDAQTSDKTARASRELAAIVGGTEKATQSILQAAEEIDHAAGTLSAALKTGHDKGLAHDIQERVVQIFEACNFQDLTGQRVAHAVAALGFVEERIARLLEIWRAIEQFKPVVFGEPGEGDRRFLNGPMLSGDGGHSTQDDIDGIFAAPALFPDHALG
jgi:chemotaxis protein CheZ